MRIESPKTLERFREPGLCELCQEFVSFPEPHHIYARGQSDAFRNDTIYNLVKLCRACHAKAEQEAGMREECLRVVSKREDIDLDDLKTMNLMFRHR